MGAFEPSRTSSTSPINKVMPWVGAKKSTTGPSHGHQRKTVRKSPNRGTSSSKVIKSPESLSSQKDIQEENGIFMQCFPQPKTTEATRIGGQKTPKNADSKNQPSVSNTTTTSSEDSGIFSNLKKSASYTIRTGQTSK